MGGPQFKVGETNINYYKWRPIIAKVATLQEVDTYYSLCDLADVNEALDIKEDAEAFYMSRK